MLTIKLKNVLIFVCFAACSIYTQEKPSCPNALIIKYKAEFNKKANQKLFALADTMKANPNYFLDNVFDFYTQMYQLPQNHTIFAYAQSPVLNFKKCCAYLRLAHKINEQIFYPHVNAIIEKMSTPLDPSHSQEFRDSQLEHLATLADDPFLNEQASDLFIKEWPFESIRIELEMHKSNLEALKVKFENEKQKLSLSEQNDISLERFTLKLTNNINVLNRTAQIIEHRKFLKKICTNPFAFITQCIQEDYLEETLERYTLLFPVKDQNELCKSLHPQGHGLLHEICLSTKLSTEQKITAIQILEKHDDIHINEHTVQGKTPLDVLSFTQENEAVRHILVSLGAQHALPKVISLKKSYDTPPSTPDITFDVRLKRTVSFQHDKTH